MSANAILKLQKVGFTAEQVEALADLIDTQAASKADLEKTEHRLDTRIIEVKAELKTDLARLEARLVWLIVVTGVGVVVAVLGGGLGIAKLLGH